MHRIPAVLIFLCFQNTIGIYDGLSDFHKMVVNNYESNLKKHSRTEGHNRDYKHFDQTRLKNDLWKKQDQVLLTERMHFIINVAFCDDKTVIIIVKFCNEKPDAFCDKL